jgi:choline-phosphate cytidylyltransferase
MSSSVSLNGNGSSHHADFGKAILATEGWLELFLTPAEKYNFSKWNEVVKDKSLVHSFTRKLFEYLAKYLPNNLAPTLLTFSGLVCLSQTWYLAYTYQHIHPTASTWFSMIGITIFFVISSLYGPHADLMRQHTSLSDLFKYACDSASAVFLTLLTVQSLGGDTLELQWYAVQAVQLVLFLKHLSAFRRKAGLRYHLGAGPGEVLVTCVGCLALRAIFGLSLLKEIVGTIWDAYSPVQLTGNECMRILYYGLLVSSLINSYFLKSGWTKFGLLTSLSMRLIPALLLHFGMEPSPLTTADVICDGLFMSVLTTDIALAKMAGRELHPWVVLMSLAAVLSHSIILTLVSIYFVGVFSDLCFYLNLPLLTVCRNVYCDGVYDLCHIGHKRAFQNALQLGNRLFVGVVGDKDASEYKRPPIMSAKERCAEVEACKAVTKVIPDAPCFGLTQEFLDEHQIHVVAFGEEYLEKYPDPKDDPYYGYVRQIGIGVPVPRTHALSTSDLISRIQKISADSLKKKSPT